MSLTIILLGCCLSLVQCNAEATACPEDNCQEEVDSGSLLQTYATPLVLESQHHRADSKSHEHMTQRVARPTSPLPPVQIQTAVNRSILFGGMDKWQHWLYTSAPLPLLCLPLGITLFWMLVSCFTEKSGGNDVLVQPDCQASLFGDSFGSQTELVAASMLYVFITPILMTTQSYLMAEGRYPYPFTLNCVCEITYLVIGIGVNWWRSWPQEDTPSLHDFILIILPLAAATVIGYASLLYGMALIPLAVTSMLLSSQTIFVLLFSNVLGLERSTLWVLFAVIVITLGLFVSAWGESHRVHSGARLGFATTGMWVQKVCVVLDLLGSAVELRGGSGQLPNEFTMFMVLVMMAACSATVFAQYWLSLIAGGLTKNVIQTVRNPLTVVVCSIVLGQRCSSMSALGYCIVVCGAILFHGVHSRPQQARGKNEDALEQSQDATETESTASEERFHGDRIEPTASEDGIHGDRIRAL